MGAKANRSGGRSAARGKKERKETSDEGAGKSPLRRPQRDSNTQPSDLESDALPLSYGADDAPAQLIIHKYIILPNYTSDHNGASLCFSTLLFVPSIAQQLDTTDPGTGLIHAPAEKRSAHLELRLQRRKHLERAVVPVSQRRDPTGTSRRSRELGDTVPNPSALENCTLSRNSLCIARQATSRRANDFSYFSKEVRGYSTTYVLSVHPQL